jgi:hypothetical protein
MSRRAVLLMLVAAVVAPGVPGARAADAAPEPPRLTCTRRIADSAVDDAYANPTGVASANTATTKAPGLDLEALYLRGTDTDVQLFAKVQDIPAPADMTQRDIAYRYAFTIKLGGKSFEIAELQKNPVYASALTGTSYPTTNPAVVGTTGAVDPASNLVYVVLNRAKLEAVIGAPVPDGTPLEVTSVRSEWIAQDNPNTRFKSDEIVPAADKKTWTVGDNYCFGPPPAQLSAVTATAAQFTDVTTLSAKLVDESGAALADQPVTFTVTGAPGGGVTGRTNADGVATAPYAVAVPAGTYPVRADFAGTADIGAASATGSLTVTVEGTAFRPLAAKATSATARTVTATLLDDDGKPVAAQRVACWVGGKAASSPVTDKTGRATCAAKAGQQVQVKFAGAAGRLAAAASKALKA